MGETSDKTGLMSTCNEPDGKSHEIIKNKPVGGDSYPQHKAAQGEDQVEDPKHCGVITNH